MDNKEKDNNSGFDDRIRIAACVLTAIIAAQLFSLSQKYDVNISYPFVGILGLGICYLFSIFVVHASIELIKRLSNISRNNDSGQEQIRYRNSPISSLKNEDRYISPLKSLELFFKNYTNISGRSSRSSFWWCLLLDKVAINSITQIADVTLRNNGVAGWIYHPNLGGTLSILWLLITLVPSIALGVRRLHDTNRSGWWLLLSFTVIGIIPLIIWFCSSGTQGTNTYGADQEAGLK